MVQHLSGASEILVKRQTKCKALLRLVLQGQLDGEMLDVRRFDDKISKSEKINDLNLSTSDCLASMSY